jgi:hypothetical protein
MDAPQVYETTIYNRDLRRAFAFATVPANALPSREVPPAEVLGRDFESEGRRLEPVEAWSLPFLIDTLLGRPPDFPPFERWPPFDPDFPPWGLRRRRGRGPSAFAQHLTYSPVIPFESSPLGSKSLAGVVTTAGGAVGAYVTRDPLLLVTVPLGIVLCRAAVHVGDGVGIVLRTIILRWAGIEAADAPEPDGE